MSENQNLTEQMKEDGGAADEIIETLSESDASFVVEEKKPVNRSTIVTFVVLVLGAAGVWFMYQRTGPKSAQAASKETVQAKQTINQFLSGGDMNIKLMEQMLRNTQMVVEQFLSYPSMTQVPLSDLRTNPFRVRPETSPQDATELTESQEKRKREEERLAARTAVERMQLQSIMYGESRKACMINGALYVEGQQMDDFTIDKISPASVIVRNGPYRFELRMQR